MGSLSWVLGTFFVWLTCPYLVFSAFCLLETYTDLSSALDPASHSLHCCGFTLFYTFILVGSWEKTRTRRNGEVSACAQS